MPRQARPGHNLSLFRRIISPLNFGVLIAQDQRTFFTFGNTFNGNMANIHDSMYFGNSKDSIGIQLADLSSYLIARHLEQDSSTEDFYNRIQDRIVYFKVEPE